MGQRLFKRLTTLGRQTVLHIVGDGIEAMEGSQEVGIRARVGKTGGASVITKGRDARWWSFAVGVDNCEVAWDVGAQRREDLRAVVCRVDSHRRDLLDACRGRLHDHRVLNSVGVDIIDTLVVPSTDRVDLGVEVSAAWTG